jgi:RimJ/RimL family protein N-acetyltransferase
MRNDDAAALAARRSEPETARYQAWSAPYSPERAQTLVAEVLATDGPSDDNWWTMTIADPDDRAILGDLCVRLSWSERCAEIGYTLDRLAWGHGYAVEAVEALVEWLWKSPAITRVQATLHPDNIASAQVLERTGFVFEGRTRLSFWVGDDNSDDGLYGMTRADWIDWRDRPRAAATSVRLTEITPDNLRRVNELQTHASQTRFVSPVAASLGTALFPPIVDGAPLVPWLRAIEADDELVGFVMMSQATAHHPEPFIWRLLIDRRHQRRGVGSTALDLVIDHCKASGAASVLVSWTEGRGSPAPMYLARGFVPTGDLDDGETVARLSLG